MKSGLDKGITVMSLKSKKSLISGPITLFVILTSLFFLNLSTGLAQEAKAPDFQAVDLDGKNISLSDYQGEVVLLHITNIEDPLCRFYIYCKVCCT